MAHGGSRLRPATDAADAAGNRRRRPRRHRQRHQDARYRIRILPRDLVRQPAAGGAWPREGIDHLRRAPQCARREHLVAQALRAPRGERVRQPARVKVRRDRQRGAVRERQGAVGARVLPRQHRDVARDLHAHARACHGQPSGQCAFSREAQPDRRGRGQARRAEQRRECPGRAIHPRPPRCVASDAGGTDHGPDQQRRGLCRWIPHRQPPLCLRGAALVYQSSFGNLRHRARADGRRRVPDARRCFRAGGRGAARQVRDLLVDAGTIGKGAHETAQARLGSPGFRLRRPPHAI